MGTHGYSIQQREEFGVSVSRVLDATHMQQVFNLAKCVKKVQPDRKFFRRFKGLEGGNTVNYLGSYLVNILPNVYRRLHDAVQFSANHMRWPDNVDNLGVRTVEFVEYDLGGRFKTHRDKNSTYTIVVLLTERSNFTGGTFEIEDSTGKSTEIWTERGDAVVFLSETYHRVNPVESGSRIILTVEYWKYASGRFHENRILIENSRSRLPSLKKCRSIDQDPLFIP